MKKLYLRAFTRIHLLFLLLTLFSSLTHCGHPLDAFYKEIESYGYIYYSTPLQYAGPGTLISGAPKQMQLIAAPDTCFPKAENSLLLKKDETTLPNHYKNIMVDSTFAGKFFDELSKTGPAISLKQDYKEVKKMQVEFNGVHIEYLDAVLLASYYQNAMPSICKDYLDYVAFIIQTIKADEVKFSFYDKQDGMINITADKIKQMLDINYKVTWQVEEGTTLHIKTPTYVGYQLASLLKKDNGFSFMRASKVRLNKWVFVPINIFDKKSLAGSPIEIELDWMEPNPDDSDFFAPLNEITPPFLSAESY